MSCHGNGTGLGSVQILNTPSQYQASAIYDIVVRVSDDTKLGAGFQFSAETAAGQPAGTLSALDANTQPNVDDSAWINHTETGVDNSVTNWAANGNSADFTVRWTAPATDVGTVTFWAAGNAINDNDLSTGDTIYLANQSATFIQVPAVSEWGLVILALGTLIGGSLTVLRRNRWVTD